jgi:hypothetical protein
MKTTILAALFALGVGFAAMPAASAAEGGMTPVQKTADGYTVTLAARHHCHMEKVCKDHWHPHCRRMRVCHED